MSLVSDLLNKTCTVLRPQFTDDGAGGEKVTGFTTLATAFPILFSQRSSSTTTQDGGRQWLQLLTVYSEWVPEAQLDINDVLTNITDAFGDVETDLVNGKTVNAAYKVVGREDPNGERDHLEIPVEHYHGRTEGQP